MLLTDEMLDSIERSVLCWLATVDATGTPNVSPKEVFAADGDALLIAHIASPRTIRNLAQNARACASMVDVFEQVGHKFVGTASVIEATSDAFEEFVTPLVRITAGLFPIKAVIRLEVERAESIVAPSKWMYPNEDPIVRRVKTLAAYRVRDP